MSFLQSYPNTIAYTQGLCGSGKNSELELNTNMRTATAFQIMNKDQLVCGVNVDEIVKIFENLGYECKVNWELQGQSGVMHPFDIIAQRGSEAIVLDLVSFRASLLDTPASDAEVIEQLQISGIQIRAKGWDCGVYQSFVVYLTSHLSASSDEILASRYDPFGLFLKQNNITIIRSENIRDVADKLQTMFDKVELDCSISTG